MLQTKCAVKSCSFLCVHACMCAYPRWLWGHRIPCYVLGSVSEVYDFHVSFYWGSRALWGGLLPSPRTTWNVDSSRVGLWWRGETTGEESGRDGSRVDAVFLADPASNHILSNCLVSWVAAGGACSYQELMFSLVRVSLIPIHQALSMFPAQGRGLERAHSQLEEEHTIHQ